MYNVSSIVEHVKYIQYVQYFTDRDRGVVCRLSIAGDQVPVIPSFDISFIFTIALPSQ